ncbi:DNA-binding protein [Pseudomonas fulva]|uniref:DNA-binding protein n=1 Tax=Pseudomonas fulva TaxID=47880 RepID=UPI00201E3658|nr:DNA-binding protein [Pseudomonas fulva]UQY32632.1 DNA-binding protein [Pseudomonas fulva]
MAAPKALTPDQVKQRFRQRGITITQWADQHGYKRNAVYRVLNGFDKANYGKAHDIAVALGLKLPELAAA